MNVGYYPGDRAPEVNPEGSLTGSAQQMVDRIGEYADTGVQGLNIAIRPPVDWDALAVFVEEVMPHFAAR